MTVPIELDVRRTGKRFDAQARLDLPAESAVVWGVITQYEALSRFMPGIRACRVTSQQAAGADGIERLTLEQTGEFRLLMLSQTIRVTLDVHQRPMQWAEARAQRFEVSALNVRALDAFEGRYELKPHTTRGKPRVELHYTAKIVLRLPPPPAVGSAAVKQNLFAQLRAIEGEVGRRAAAAG
jgi:phage baseplate assembly protein W